MIRVDVPFYEMNSWRKEPVAIEVAIEHLKQAHEMGATHIDVKTNRVNGFEDMVTITPFYMRELTQQELFIKNQLANARIERHKAEERALYEKLKRKFENDTIAESHPPTR